jgi:hypothetical protein
MTPAPLSDLNQVEAMRIIRTVGAAGQPPPLGVAYFSDGFEPSLQLLDADYFAAYLKEGGSAFKLVVGHYGGGKTHYLYLLRELAWRHDFVVSYVSLTPEETPFHRLDLVYRAVASSLIPPARGDIPPAGLANLLKETIARWRAKGGDPALVEAAAASAVRDLEDLNFLRATRKALLALIRGGEENEELALTMVQWLSGQGYDRAMFKEHGILGAIDRSTAFSCLRSLARFVKTAGFAGLVILFDEAERVPSMSGKQKEFMLSNLRELIDETARGTLPGTFVAYAVPSFRFFEGATGVYEAVKQRMQSMFDFANPSGVRIDLEEMVKDQNRHLEAIGLKLWAVFEAAYAAKLPEAAAASALRLVAEAVLEAKFADISYRRLFVQSIVRGFEQLRRKPESDLSREWARQIVDSFIAGG